MRSAEVRTQMSESDMLEIFFDSFELSQGSAPLQYRIFDLLACLFPSVDLPSISSAEFENKFFQRVEPFLTKGQYHLQSTSSLIRTVIQDELGAFQTAFDPQWTDTTRTEALRSEIFFGIIKRDLRFLRQPHEVRPHDSSMNRSMSYIRKYFVEEQYPKNPYSRTIVDEIKKTYDEQLQTFRFLQSALTYHVYTRLGVSKLDTNLVYLSQVWSERNGGKKFWEKTTRRTRE